MRILVADDDKHFLRILADILAGAGHSVIEARDGKQALELALEKNPDLIILDAVLPGLLGTEISRKLRNHSHTAAIPVLLISTGIAELEAASGDPEEFLADAFLHKPVRPDALLRCVDRLARLREAGPAGPVAGAERRRHLRLPIDVEVTARTAEVLLHHPMINISSGGIYLELDHALRPQSEVDLCFGIPETGGMICAGGTVAWCKKLEESDRWGLGIRFIEITEDNLEKIQCYTRSLRRIVHVDAPESDDASGGE